MDENAAARYIIDSKQKGGWGRRINPTWEMKAPHCLESTRRNRLSAAFGQSANGLSIFDGEQI